MESITENKIIKKIFVITDKKKEPKIMEGIYETVLIFSVPEDGEMFKNSNNKTDDETIKEIYKQLDEGVPIREIAEQLDITPKTIYNYKNQRQR